MSDAPAIDAEAADPESPPPAVDAAAAPAADPGAGATAKPPAGKGRRLRLILAIAGGLVCALGIAAGAGAAIVGARPPQVELAVNTPSTFYQLPDVIGSLAVQGKRPHRARVAVTLEVEEAKLAQIKAQEAAIVAATQDHLLDLQTADLAGRTGAENLRAFIREVILERAGPGVVRNVLFTSFIVD